MRVYYKDKEGYHYKETCSDISITEVENNNNSSKKKYGAVIKFIVDEMTHVVPCYNINNALDTMNKALASNLLDVTFAEVLQ